MSTGDFKPAYGPICAPSNLDRCELDEGVVVSLEFVISGCDAPGLPDLIEEPFDQVAGPSRRCGHHQDPMPRSGIAPKVDMAESCRYFAIWTRSGLRTRVALYRRQPIRLRDALFTNNGLRAGSVAARNSVCLCVRAHHLGIVTFAKNGRFSSGFSSTSCILGYWYGCLFCEGSPLPARSRPGP